MKTLETKYGVNCKTGFWGQKKDLSGLQVDPGPVKTQEEKK